MTLLLVLLTLYPWGGACQLANFRGGVRTARSYEGVSVLVGSPMFWPYVAVFCLTVGPLVALLADTLWPWCEAVARGARLAPRYLRMVQHVRLGGRGPGVARTASWARGRFGRTFTTPWFSLTGYVPVDRWPGVCCECESPLDDCEALMRPGSFAYCWTCVDQLVVEGAEVTGWEPKEAKE